MRCVIKGFAKALPARVVTNDDLSKLMDTSDEWIVQRTGISTRHWVTEPTTTSDLAVQAARQTLQAIGSEKIDAIIAATLSPDFSCPGIGVQIQSKLKQPTIPAYDVRNQCCGFLFGLEMAHALVQSGQYNRILLVGAEVQSTALDISTRGRDLAVLFGDGAGSCVVERVEEDQVSGLNLEILGTELHSDGDHLQELWCEHPGSAHFPTRLTPDLVSEAKCFPKMNGKRVFENAIKRMVEVSHSLMKRLQLSPDSVRLLVPHQANLRINKMVAEHLGFEESRVFSTVQKYGNTTAASIPIGLADVAGAQILKRGDIVLSPAFGSGFTWGAAMFRAI